MDYTIDILDILMWMFLAAGFLLISGIAVALYKAIKYEGFKGKTNHGNADQPNSGDQILSELQQLRRYEDMKFYGQVKNRGKYD